MIILSRFLVVLALSIFVIVPLPAAARSAEPDPRFSWPLSPEPTVVTPFERPSNEYGPGHRGVDLAASPGQQVLAAGPGVVVFAGDVAGQGVVSIDHDGELRTTYEAVTPTVAAGTQVYGGQPIGMVATGHPSCPVADCLHWGVRRGEEYLNPLALIRTVSMIRLKPWEGSGYSGYTG
jgi:murein DD-endopeptidase MepM/ murein hydrolase activator NlpD